MPPRNEGASSIALVVTKRIMTLALPYDGVLPPDSVLLVANDRSSKFVVPRGFFVKVSKFAEDILGEGDVDEPEVPLMTPAATAPIVALLATWLVHHATSESLPPLRATVSLPPNVASFDGFFADPWDHGFVKLLLLPGFDMRGVRQVVQLSFLASFLQIPALGQLCADVVAIGIRKAVRTGTASFDPLVQAAQWTQRSPFSESEVQNMMTFMSEACTGTALKPTSLA